MNSYTQSAIITGSATRFGNAIAESLASLGYDIVLHYNKSQEEAFAAQKFIQNSYNQKCHLVQGDFNSSLGETIDECFHKAENCTVLVNNASIFKPKKFGQISFEEFDENMNLHVKAPFFFYRNSP